MVYYLKEFPLLRYPMSRRGTYIAVCGPIGVGKSVFARLLADQLQAEMVEEAFQTNPFLERFYEPGGIERWGLACELSFLPERYDQALEIEKLLSSGQDVVSDWTLSQCLVFARLTLSDEEFEAYRSVFERLMATSPKPDRLICLDAEHETLMRRIQGRGREMEKDMDPDYIARLRAEYLNWRDEVSQSFETLVIDTTDLALPTSDDARATALEHVWFSLGWCPVGKQVPQELQEIRISA